jgi:hypothetical protein
MPGELVFDPFMGLGTVPYCALKLGRRGAGVELSPDYSPDCAAKNCGVAELWSAITGRTESRWRAATVRGRSTAAPTLFDAASG